MPHITVEYTNDLKERIEMDTLLPLIHQSLLSNEGVFSAAGMRSRGVLLNDYFRGSDKVPHEDGFVHVTLSILAGRSQVLKQEMANRLRTDINNYLLDRFQNKEVALSIELFELNTGGNLYIQN